MGEEIDLVAKTVGASIQPLAEASGVLGPVKELADWVSTFIHYRRMPSFAKQVNRAAEKIRDAGLPPATVPDKLLRELLEGGSLEDEESMQERWANLLANAVTASAATVHPAFPEMLRQLEPEEARMLDRLAALRPGSFDQTGLEIGVARENLRRLGLIEARQAVEDVSPALGAGGGGWTNITASALGMAFVRACSAPQPPA